MRLMKTLLAATLALSNGTAAADGLADLKAALLRLQGTAPLRATLESRTWNRTGEGKDAEESSGAASISVEDDARGLRLFYAKDLLARMEAEERSKVGNPNAKTPALDAVKEFGPADLRPLIATAGDLSRRVARATYRSEKAADYNGQPARQLSFTVPVETLSDRQRKYLKQFDGGMEIWIGADGTPLASRLHIKASGRAYVVVAFDFQADEQETYGVLGERLLTTRKESKLSNSGAGDRKDNKVVTTLQAGTT